MHGRQINGQKFGKGETIYNVCHRGIKIGAKIKRLLCNNISTTAYSVKAEFQCVALKINNLQVI